MVAVVVVVVIPSRNQASGMTADVAALLTTSASIAALAVLSIRGTPQVLYSGYTDLRLWESCHKWATSSDESYPMGTGGENWMSCA